MNYQPFLDMHILLSDDLLKVVSLLTQSLSIVFAGLIVCVLSYLLVFKAKF